MRVDDINQYLDAGKNLTILKNKRPILDDWTEIRLTEKKKKVTREISDTSLARVIVFSMSIPKTEEPLVSKN